MFSPRIEWQRPGFCPTKLAMRVPIILFTHVALRLFTASMTCMLPVAAFSFELRDGVSAVVELFTSQGCSPCPAADRLLSELSTEDNVISLAYHVDYWDYAGWADTFALPANGELQKAYAQTWSTSRIYTPQMIINGEHGVVGSNAEEVQSALAASRLVLPVSLEVPSQDVVVLKAEPHPELSKAVVWLVTFRNWAEVEVERGENIGRRLSYTNIVITRRPVGMWDPINGADIQVPVSDAVDPDSDGFALIIQERNGHLPGRILGAAAVMLEH
ncbi:DUF1223 domain-containing protein [Pelagibacterium lentulum]|nr:DUF1223 domain-containing protein [Pelagibacterium lentulum]